MATECREIFARFLFSPFLPLSSSLSVSDFKNGQISMSQIISLFKAQLLFGWIEDRVKSFTSEEGQINTGRKISV